MGLMQLSANISKVPDAEPFIVRIAQSDSQNGNNEALIAPGDKSASETGLRPVLRIRNQKGGDVPIPPDLEYLCAGDIIRVNRHAGEIRVLYRRKSPHNVLF